MIKIGQPYIEKKGEQVRLCASVSIGEARTLLWYETEAKYGEFFVPNCDSFLTALLPYAMIQNHDIVCEGKVSERLHQLKSEYIPALANNVATHHLIRIEAILDSSNQNKGSAVGTGFTGGVDCMYTLMTHEQAPKNYQITHLAILDVHFQNKENFGIERKKAEQYSQQYGYECVPISSNLAEMLKGQLTTGNIPYMQSVLTYRMVSAILAMQGLFRVYYFSSSVALKDFEIETEEITECGTMDLLTLSNLSTESTKFYSSGLEADRIEKTIAVAEYPPSYQWLHPCVNLSGYQNCGRCEKCLRTMLPLYYEGKLERYKEVFPLSDFEKEKELMIARGLAEGDPIDHERLLRYIEAKQIVLSPEILKKMELFRRGIRAEKRLRQKADCKL